MNKLQIKQWGNSKAIRLPKDLLFSMNADTGDFLELYKINETEFKLVVSHQHPRKRKSLQELLASTSGDFTVLNEWDCANSVGEEML